MVSATGQAGLDNWFLGAMKRRRIVRDPVVFTDQYRPREILFRDEEATRIASELLRLVDYPDFKGPGHHVIITGPVGTGKTVTVQRVAEQLRTYADIKGVELLGSYVNCRDVKSVDGAYQRIAIDFGIKVQPGWQITKTHNALKARSGNKILFLDEVDRLITLVGDDFLYSFSRAQGTSLVLISNRTRFEELIRDPAILSSVHGGHVRFTAYTADQIESILQMRVEVGFFDSPTGEVLKVVAAKAADRNGDARYALMLLDYAASYAEREGCDICLDHIERADRYINMAELQEAFTSLTRHERWMYSAIVYCYPSTTKVKIMDRYREVAGSLALSEHRAHEVLSRLDKYGLVQIDAKRGVGTNVKLLADVEAALSVVEGHKGL